MRKNLILTGIKCTVVMMHLYLLGHAQCQFLVPILTPAGNACGSHDYQLNYSNANANVYTYQVVPPGACTIVNGQSSNPGFVYATPNTVNPVTITVTQSCNGANSTIVVLPCCTQGFPFVFNGTQAQVPNITPPSGSSGFVYNGTAFPNLEVYGTLTINATTVFNNCNFLMAPGALINVVGATTEVGFIGCTFNALCGQMWQGLRSTQALSFKIINSTISDAQYGLEIQSLINGLALANNTFQRNYIDIYRAPGTPINAFANVATSYFDNCTFIGSTTLLPPFANQFPLPINNTSRAGILINDINDFKINSVVAGGPNRFQNLNIGVAAYRCNVDINNATFQNIINSPSYLSTGLANPGGCAVYCEATDAAPRSLNVGVIQTNFLPCTFTNVQRGINAYHGMNVIARQNTFNNPANNTLNSTAIRAHRCASRNFNLDLNTITNNNQGIWLSIVNNANVRITTNTIRTTLNTTGFWSRSGIIVTNNFSTTDMLLTVTGNILGNSFAGAANDMRMGIYLANLKAKHLNNQIQQPYLNISGNTINFFANAVTTGNRHYGIWMDNVTRADVWMNDILNFGPTYYSSGLTDQWLIGYNLKTTHATTIRSSNVTNIGQSVAFLGDCSFTNLRCNTFTDYINSIFLGSLNGVGSVITDQGTSTGDAWHNAWSCAAPNFRVWGTLNTGLQVNWYTEAPLTGTYDIQPWFTFGGTLWDVLNSTANPTACFIPSDDIGTRLIQIVQDSITFDQLADESRYIEQRMAYMMLYEDSALRASDPDFEAFYQQKLNSNMESFRVAMELTERSSYQDALNALAGITPANEMETFLKQVLTIEITRNIRDDYELSETEVDILNSIAYLSPMVAGDAVFYARAMLGLELNDEELALRVAYSSVNNTNSIEPPISVYPNPTDGLLHITTNDNTLITIYDLQGRVIKSTFLENGEINIAELEAGCYVLKLKNHHELITVK